MKAAIISALVAVCFLVLAFFLLEVYPTKTTLDIHVHDTYYVLAYESVVGFALIFISTCFSIAGLIGTKFKNKAFWALALLMIFMVIYFSLSIYKSFSNFNTVTSDLDLETTALYL